VNPFFVRARRSAPASISWPTTSGWRSAAAHISAVWRCVGSAAFTAAPRASSIFTAAVAPAAAQVMSGVSPVPIGRVRPSHRLQEQLHHLRAAVGAGARQRRHPELIRGVGVGSGRTSTVATRGRCSVPAHEKGCRAVVGPDVDVRAAAERARTWRRDPVRGRHQSAVDRRQAATSGAQIAPAATSDAIEKRHTRAVIARDRRWYHAPAIASRRGTACRSTTTADADFS
jgi:hypothetical protein